MPLPIVSTVPLPLEPSGVLCPMYIEEGIDISDSEFNDILDAVGIRKDGSYTDDVVNALCCATRTKPAITNKFKKRAGAKTSKRLERLENAEFAAYVRHAVICTQASSEKKLMA